MSAFALAAVAAVLWGSAAFVEKAGLNGADPRAGVVARSLGVMVGCLLFIAVQPSVAARFFEMNFKSRLWLMGGGILASVVGQIFFYRALKIGEVSRVAAVGGTWPVVAFILGVIFLGEPLTVRKGLGLFMVVCGALFLR